MQETMTVKEAKCGEGVARVRLLHDVTISPSSGVSSL